MLKTILVVLSALSIHFEVLEYFNRNKIKRNKGRKIFFINLLSFVILYNLPKFLNLITYTVLICRLPILEVWVSEFIKKEIYQIKKSFE